MILQKTWWQVEDAGRETPAEGGAVFQPLPWGGGAPGCLEVSSLCRRHPCFRLTARTFRRESRISNISNVTLYSLASWHSKKTQCRAAVNMAVWLEGLETETNRGVKNLNITPFCFWIIYTKRCGTIRTSAESLRIHFWNLTHPSGQPPRESIFSVGLEMSGFHDQSAFLTYEKAGGAGG